MNISQALKIYSDKLKKNNIDSYILDTEIILAFILNKAKEYLFTYPEKIINKRQLTKLDKLISKIIDGYPVAYIIGNKDFYGISFFVNKNVLIPRPETELIIDEVLKIGKTNNILSVIDIGTGSGCIPITIADKIKREKFKTYNIFAIDISKKALNVARKNAKLHGVTKNIQFLHGNLLNPMFNNIKKLKDDIIITANLPYLDGKWKNLLKSRRSIGLKYEPQKALYGGFDGLDYYRSLARQIKKIILLYPRKKITVLCEIENQQKKEIEKIFSFAKCVKTKKDLSGLNRLVVIKI